MSPTRMVSMAGSEVAAKAGIRGGQGEETGRGGEVEDVVHSMTSSHGIAGSGVKGSPEAVKKVSTSLGAATFLLEGHGACR